MNITSLVSDLSKNQYAKTLQFKYFQLAAIELKTVIFKMTHKKI